MFRLERADGVARVVIDHAAKRNAVGIDDWGRLAGLLAEVGVGDRVVAIASAHPGIFCAGADVGEMAPLASDIAGRGRFRLAMAEAFTSVRAVKVPTVALIDGGCFGAGVALALACDVRIASPRARFAVPPARLGIAYPQADVDALADAVGRGQAARLLFGADTIDAAESRHIGLVHVLEADGGEAWVRRMAANAPSSLLGLKAMLDHQPGGAARFEASFGSPDFAEGLAAFMARRDPVFG